MKLTKEQQLLQTLITRSWEDESFKNELITNPITTIESITGKPLKLAEGKSIVVEDQTNESTIYINIPAKLKLDDVELNEEQLEIIAGGGILVDPIGKGVSIG